MVNKDNCLFLGSIRATEPLQLPTTPCSSHFFWALIGAVIALDLTTNNRNKDAFAQLSYVAVQALPLFLRREPINAQ